MQFQTNTPIKTLFYQQCYMTIMIIMCKYWVSNGKYTLLSPCLASFNLHFIVIIFECMTSKMHNILDSIVRIDAYYLYPDERPQVDAFDASCKLIFAEMSERSLCFWWNERMRMRIFIVNAKIHALCVQMPSCGWFRMWMCVKEFQNLFRNKLAIISLSL